jgi:hypothetical protein
VAEYWLAGETRWKSVRSSSSDASCTMNLTVARYWTRDFAVRRQSLTAWTVAPPNY